MSSSVHLKTQISGSPRKDYKAKGYETFIQKSAGKDKETLYRVLIGKSLRIRKKLPHLQKILKQKKKAKAVIFKE